MQGFVQVGVSREVYRDIEANRDLFHTMGCKVSDLLLSAFWIV